MKKQYIAPNILTVKASTQEILAASHPSLGLSDKTFDGNQSLSKKHTPTTNLWDDSWETPEDEEEN